MIKNLFIMLSILTLTSCASISEKMPKLEKKACTGENKTLADVFCKKE